MRYRLLKPIKSNRQKRFSHRRGGAPIAGEVRPRATKRATHIAPNRVAFRFFSLETPFCVVVCGFFELGFLVRRGLARTLFTSKTRETRVKSGRGVAGGVAWAERKCGVYSWGAKTSCYPSLWWSCNFRLSLLAAFSTATHSNHAVPCWLVAFEWPGVGSSSPYTSTSLLLLPATAVCTFGSN